MGEPNPDFRKVPSDAFPDAFLGTRNEGLVGCTPGLPEPGQTHVRIGGVWGVLERTSRGLPQTYLIGLNRRSPNKVYTLILLPPSEVQ